jgi:hypothetical protein
MMNLKFAALLDSLLTCYLLEKLPPFGAHAGLFGVVHV